VEVVVVLVIVVVPGIEFSVSHRVVVDSGFVIAVVVGELFEFVVVSVEAPVISNPGISEDKVEVECVVDPVVLVVG
jgi:hypothetical protein